MIAYQKKKPVVVTAFCFRVSVLNRYSYFNDSTGFVRAVLRE